MWVDPSVLASVSASQRAHAIGGPLSPEEPALLAGFLNFVFLLMSKPSAGIAAPFRAKSCQRSCVTCPRATGPGREERFQEILHRANWAVLEYLQEWAGVTRSGYHGVRVDGREPGRFGEAGLVVTSWLQGASRDGDPQDHVHNQIARITRTVRDSKWRALDTASLRAVLGALQGVAATTVECELTREFGVAWVPRADGRGHWHAHDERAID
jgi:hypothetical protein